MFCDLVGSTALSARLDPEDWRTVVREYQRTCAEVVHRLDGHVAQYLGDGLLVYFGYPQAHEDDARRAVQAGLDILAALQAPSLASARGTDLQVRIGIHTGLVVVGEIGNPGASERLALGETPNVAARLQALAEPNTVVISAATDRLVTGFFERQDLGLHSVKGLSARVNVYRVVGASGAETRLDALNVTGLTPLVGREEEVAFLRRRWEQSRRGTGQVVLLSGEPGIGKSRLVRVLTESLAGEPHGRIEWRSSPYYQHTAFHPVIEHVQRQLRLDRDDPLPEKLRKLEDGLRAFGLEPSDTVPWLGALLSLPLPDRYPPSSLAPQQKKAKTLDALVAWIRAAAERRPTLLIAEDLHWLDASTLELLDLLIDQLAPSPLLQLLTFRPDFHAPWPMLPHLTHLTLSRLPHRQIEAMVDSIARSQPLSADVRRQLIAKTDGVPLFVEELTKAVMESGLAIPATLHDSLMARLDRLATVKEIAQLGATLGREFDYDLIRAVSPVEEKTLQQALTRLVDAELLYQRGVPPEARYVFKHALIQDAAYQSLLKSRRQQYHRQIAQALEARRGEATHTPPELLAHHYTEAGLAAQGLKYWRIAGEEAVQRSANVEAISHLTRGLELLGTRPGVPDEAHQELAMQMVLGVALRATKGFAGPEVGKAYGRALELCRQGGESTQLIAVLRGLWEFHELRAEYRTASELGEQLLALTDPRQDSAMALVARDVMGDTFFWLGRFSAARAHLEEGFALYDVRQHDFHVFHYGYDSGIACLCFGAWALWFLGYPDQATKRIELAASMARTLGHPFTFALALLFAAQLHSYRRESEPTRELAAEVMRISTKESFPMLLAQATIIQGWALAEQGRAAEAIAQIRQGMADWKAIGHELEWSHFLGLLAEAYRLGDQVGEGLEVLGEALAFADTTGERFWQPELYRLRGQLSLQSASSAEADVEASFRKAIDLARELGAKALELRATTSLARLWQRQGRTDEARSTLAGITGSFTEGFATIDWLETKSAIPVVAT